jgi:ubiquinone/menaquinone biosynthesis C-methylase UbiE
MKILRKIELFIFNNFGDQLEYLISEQHKSNIFTVLLLIEFLPDSPRPAPNITNRLLAYQFKKKYNPQNPSEYFRQLILDKIWGGANGMKWHQQETLTDPNMEKYRVWRNKQIEQIKQLIAKYSNIENIIEIGCGNGLYLNQIRETLGNDYNYWGIDLSRDQITKNKELFKKINFIEGQAGKIESLDILENTLYITFGTLNCFTQSELISFFNHIYKLKGFQAIAISEWIIDFNPEIEYMSKPMSPTLYNHNYNHHLEATNFKIFLKEYHIRDFEQPGYVRTIITALKN